MRRLFTAFVTALELGSWRACCDDSNFYPLVDVVHSSSDPTQSWSPEARAQQLFPESMASTFLRHSFRYQHACARAQDPAALDAKAALAVQQKCFDGKLSALDVTLHRTCSKSTFATVVHVRVGITFCEPPKIENLVKELREHALADSPVAIIFSMHEGCGALHAQYAASLVQAPWGLNGTKPILQSTNHDDWREVDTHLCSMVGALVFIQGEGGISYLAERTRARRGKTTISGLVERPLHWLEAKKYAADQVMTLMIREAYREKKASAFLEELSKPREQARRKRRWTKELPSKTTEPKLTPDSDNEASPTEKSER